MLSLSPIGPPFELSQLVSLLRAMSLRHDLLTAVPVEPAEADFSSLSALVILINVVQPGCNRSVLN